jgi:opacity protein-like surface antigen
MRTVGTAVVLMTLTTSAIAADLPLKAPPAPVPWSWNGIYVGVHSGAFVPGEAKFSDPFGSPIFGDRVRTPGWFLGAQAGYNWQAANSPWVFGVEADFSGIDADGTITCFAVSGNAINANCRARPDLTGTLTGRIGYAAGPQGRTLVYLKGGFAWLHSRIDMATNDAGELPPGSTAVLPDIVTSHSSPFAFGGTIGAGVEYALTPAWSLSLEYDYLRFARRNVSNVGSITIDQTAAIVAEFPPGRSGVEQDLHKFRIGLNYRWGADPRSVWSPDSYASADPYKAATYKSPPAPSAPGWEFEIGGRFVGAWSRFQDDLGRDRNDGISPLSLISRLTYTATDTKFGEVFARLDTPSNVFVKGFYGRGKIRDGNQHDEDYGLSFPVIAVPGTSLFVPYTNTLSPKIDGTSQYGTVDLGYSFLRGQTYKAGGFVGYNYYEQKMAAHGCFQIANPDASNCIPPAPVTRTIITQDTKWHSLRVGLGGEFMPLDRVKLSGEVAYLPYVQFNGLDRHLFDNGSISSINPDHGQGRGVQLEGVISYLFTQNFSVGVGGRYWAMWTSPTAVATRTLDCNDPAAGCVVPTGSSFMKGAVEQASVFVQASLKFDSMQANP